MRHFVIYLEQWDIEPTIIVHQSREQALEYISTLFKSIKEGLNNYDYIVYTSDFFKDKFDLALIHYLNWTLKDNVTYRRDYYRWYKRNKKALETFNFVDFDSVLGPLDIYLKGLTI